MEYTNENEAIIKRGNDENLIICYSADWCGPCRFMAPTIEKLAESINIIKVNIDDSPVISNQENIRAVPTFIHYKKGVEISRQSGARSAEQLTGMYNS